MNNKLFKNFYNAQMITSLGDWLSYVAIPMYIYTITQNPISLAIFNVCKFLPNILITPFIGKIRYKYSSIQMMAFADIIRGIFFLGYLLTDNTLIIYFITFVISLFTAIFNPVKYSIISKIVEEKEIEKANSKIAAITKMMMLIGPSIGGIVMGILGKGVLILINSFSFFISFYLIFKMSDQSFNEDTITSQKSSLSYLKKLKYLFHNKKNILILTILFAIVNCLFGALNTLFPIISDKFDNSSIIYGYIISTLGLGLLIGVKLTDFFSKKYSYMKLYSYATIVSSFFLFTFGISNNYIFVLVMVLGFSIGNGIQEISSVTYTQLEGQEDSLELFTISQSTTSSLVLISTSLSAIATKIYGITPIITILAFLIFFIGLIIFIFHKNSIDL